MYILHTAEFHSETLDVSYAKTQLLNKVMHSTCSYDREVTSELYKLCFKETVMAV